MRMYRDNMRHSAAFTELVFSVITEVLVNAVFMVLGQVVVTFKILIIFGMCFMFLLGFLYDVYGSYTVSFIVLGAVPMVSLIPQCIYDITQLGISTADYK